MVLKLIALELFAGIFVSSDENTCDAPSTC